MLNEQSITLQHQTPITNTRFSSTPSNGYEHRIECHHTSHGRQGGHMVGFKTTLPAIKQETLRTQHEANTNLSSTVRI
jgi:hypothetical protein